MSTTHKFVSAIADDPTAAAAGQVVPSNWNDTHVGGTANAIVVTDGSKILTEAVVGAGFTLSSGTFSNTFSTGLTGGQTAYGDTVSGGNLTFSSTFDVTKGKIITGTSAYDEVNNRYGLNQTTPLARFHLETASIGSTLAISQGVYLKNPTASAVAAPQFSPPIFWEGQANATVTSPGPKVLQGRLYYQTIQGSVATSALVFGIDDTQSGTFTQVASFGIASTSFVSTTISHTFTNVGLTSGLFRFALAQSASSGNSGIQYGTAASNNTLATGTSANLGTGVWHRFIGGLSQAAAGTGVQAFMSFEPTVNHTATVGASSYEGVRVNVLETSIGTGTNYLLRAGTGGTSFVEKFSIQRDGTTTIANIPALGTAATNYVTSNAGVISQRTSAQTLSDLALIDVQVFTTSGTWTKPANARSTSVTIVTVIGGGGGGGSGARQISGTTCSGGAGGGTGGMSLRTYSTSGLGATETVTVGASATGGVAVSATSTAGNNGTVGNDSSFGNYIKATGGGGGGGGALATGNAAGGAAGTGTLAGLVGGNAGQGIAGSAGAAGGTGGGGLTITPTATAGGAWTTGLSANLNFNWPSLAGGAAAGGAGSNGNTAPNNQGQSGSGGGSSVTAAVNGGVGGNGGNYGSAGGGGGAALNTAGNSGAGGSSSGGLVVAITYI